MKLLGLLSTTCALVAAAPPTPCQTLVHSFGARAEALTTVQDLNSDGVPELVLAGHLPVQIGFAQRIQVAMHDGSTGALIGQTTFASTHTGSWRVSIANVGDCDGDGDDDFAVGDASMPSLPPFVSFPIGQVKVFDSSTFFSAPSSALRAGFGSLTALASSDVQYGWAVAGVGDQDGDGRDDIAVGLPQFPSAVTPQGRVEIVRLVPNGPQWLAQLIRTHDGTVGPWDRFGESVLGLGLYDCVDAIEDYAIGAPAVQGSGQTPYVRLFSNGQQDLTPPPSQPYFPSFGASLALLSPPSGRRTYLGIGAPLATATCTGPGSQWAVWHRESCGAVEFFDGGFDDCLLPMSTTTMAGFYGDFTGPGCATGNGQGLFHAIGGDPANKRATVSHFSQAGNSSHCYNDRVILGPTPTGTFGNAVTGIVHASGEAWVAVADFGNRTVYVYDGP
jgi:hypothetical protein